MLNVIFSHLLNISYGKSENILNFQLKMIIIQYMKDN